MIYANLNSGNLLSYLESSKNFGIEQCLSVRIILDGFRIFTWIRIVKEKSDPWCVYKKESLDCGDENFIDIDEFAEIGDPDAPEGERRTFTSAEDAIEFAISLGAKLDKFVPYGGMQYIYRDYYIANGKPIKSVNEWFTPRKFY